MGLKMNLIDAIKEYGVNNLRVFILSHPIISQRMGFYSLPMVDTNAPLVLTEYCIDEDRYPVKNNYKITLKRVKIGAHFNMLQAQAINHEHFYISDLSNLLKERGNEYQLFALVDDPVYYQRLN